MRELKGNWLDLFNGFSVAFDVKKLFAVFIALSLTVIIIGVIPWLTLFAINPAALNTIDLKLAFANVGDGNTCAFTNLASFKHMAGQMMRNHSQLAIQVRSALYTTMGIYKYPFLLALVLMLLAVWGYFGGMVTRIAAINLTKDESLGFGKAAAFASKKFTSFFAPIVVCLMGLIFFALCNAAGGLIGLIPVVGPILVALGLPLAILSGFIMLFIIIGLFSHILFYPTIGVEGTDTFDAISRSFQYLYARPWHYIWYTLTAIAYGIPTIIFVGFFARYMIKLAVATASMGMGVSMHNILSLTNLPIVDCLKVGVPMDMGSPISASYYIAAVIMAVWLILICGLAASYIVSYSLSANTIIYLLLRKKVDEIEMKEVYDEEMEEMMPGNIPVAPPATNDKPK
ncbi:MAG: hypothetical protein WC980_04110 [Candidatus Brocadiia bacterium]